MSTEYFVWLFCYWNHDFFFQCVPFHWIAYFTLDRIECVSFKSIWLKCSSMYLHMQTFYDCGFLRQWFSSIRNWIMYFTCTIHRYHRSTTSATGMNSFVTWNFAPKTSQNCVMHKLIHLIQCKCLHGQIILPWAQLALSHLNEIIWHEKDKPSRSFGDPSFNKFSEFSVLILDQITYSQI